MRILPVLSLALLIVSHSALSQTTTISGTISHREDSLKYISMSTKPAFLFAELQGDQFEFIIDEEFDRQELNSAYLVLSKNQFTNLSSLQDALTAGNDVKWGRDPIAFYIDSSEMILDVDAKEKTAHVAGSKINQQQIELSEFRKKKQEIFNEGKMSMEEIGDWGVSENLKIVRKYPESLLTVSYLNNILTVPIMFAGVAELSPGHLETIDTLISELEQHGHSRAALNELKNNFEVVSNTSSFSGDYYIPDLQVEHTEAVTQSMSDVLQQADYVVIDVWATWCIPCLNQHPEFERLALESPENIKFIGLSIDEEKADWTSRMASHPLKYDNFWLDESVVKTLKDSLNINSFPTYFIVEGTTGKVVNKAFSVDNIEEMVSGLNTPTETSF